MCLKVCRPTVCSCPLFLSYILYTFNPHFFPHPHPPSLSVPYQKFIYNPSFFLPTVLSPSLSNFLSLSLSYMACKHKHLTISEIYFQYKPKEKAFKASKSNSFTPITANGAGGVSVCVCMRPFVCVRAWGILSLFTNLVNSFHNAFTLVYIALGWLSSFVQNKKAKF